MQPKVMTPAQISIDARACILAPIGEDVSCAPVATGLQILGPDDHRDSCVCS